MKNTPSQPPLLQKEHILDLYCWLDDIVPITTAVHIGRPAALAESEILTLLIWNILTLKQKTLKGLYENLKRYHAHDFPRLPSYQAFVTSCHRSLPAALVLLGTLLEDRAPTRIMDSTMLPVCKLARADHHKTARNLAAFGKNHQGWHYGFKLHVSTDLAGRLSGLALTPANVYDAQAMRTILNEYCRVAVGDTLYGARVMGRQVWEAYGTIIIAPPFPKQNKKISTPWQIELLNLRSKIESLFDYLKEHLSLVSSFPRSIAGYLVHYVQVLLGYQIMALCGR